MSDSLALGLDVDPFALGPDAWPNYLGPSEATRPKVWKPNILELNKINKILNKLNKRILGIVNRYNRIKDKVLWCKISKKKNRGTKIKIKVNEGQYVNI